jgi:hypothetical protein
LPARLPRAADAFDARLVRFEAISSLRCCMIDVRRQRAKLAVMGGLVIIAGSVMILSEIDHVGSTFASRGNT